MNAQNGAAPLILLVDDVPANLYALAAALKKDYQIQLATDGATALALAEQPNQPQLILLDVMMPQMSGIEVLRRLRENPQTGDIPVIFVSADASEQSRLDGLVLGADDYLVKPVNVTILQAQVRNLLRRKQAETALAQSEVSFRTLAESVPVGIYRTDPDGKIVYVNERYCEITGFEPKQILGRTGPVGLLPEDGGRVSESWDRSLSDKRAFVSEHRIARADGQPIWVIDQARAEVDGFGTVLGFVGSMFDITERKNAEALRLAKEQAETLSRSKSLFLSRMSHELRTPLNAILGFAQLMDDPNEPMTDSQRENVGVIIQSGEHLLKMVNEVLELSQLESSETPLHLEHVSLNDILIGSLDLVEALAADHCVTVDVQLGDCEDVRVIADRCLLVKCLHKLLSNGIKYNNARGRLSIRGSVCGDQAYVAVSDQGPGISPEQMDRLFLPFERFEGDKWETEDSIGLAVILRYVELMGGGLNVTSEWGVSSTFTLRLPLAGR